MSGRSRPSASVCATIRASDGERQDNDEQADGWKAFHFFPRRKIKSGYSVGRKKWRTIWAATLRPSLSPSFIELRQWRPPQTRASSTSRVTSLSLR